MGSDDYIAKPYSTKELILRVNKLIERVYSDKTKQELTYENYIIDLNKRIVKDEKEEICPAIWVDLW